MSLPSFDQYLDTSPFSVGKKHEETLQNSKQKRPWGKKHPLVAKVSRKASGKESGNVFLERWK